LTVSDIYDAFRHGQNQNPTGQKEAEEEPHVREAKKG